MTIPYEQIEEAYELWLETNARSNNRRDEERRRREELESDQEEIETDLSDIKKLFDEKGKGPHLLEMDFEPTTEGPEEYVSTKTGALSKCWIWKHKLLPNVEVKRFPTQSGKGFDTGVLSVKLRSLNVQKHGKVASERAAFILKLNMKSNNAAAIAAASAQPIPIDRETLIKQWVRCLVDALYSMDSSSNIFCLQCAIIGPKYLVCN